MMELFGKPILTSVTMTAKPMEIKAQLRAMNEGSAMAIHNQAYATLGITPARSVVATPNHANDFHSSAIVLIMKGISCSSATSSSVFGSGGVVTAIPHPPSTGSSSTSLYYPKPKLPPPPLPRSDTGAHTAKLPPVPPKSMPRPSLVLPAHGADAAGGAITTAPQPPPAPKFSPPPRTLGQRGPYPTAAEAATHAARNFWRPVG
jgi:hypothetical protein